MELSQVKHIYPFLVLPFVVSTGLIVDRVFTQQRYIQRHNTDDTHYQTTAKKGHLVFLSAILFSNSVASCLSHILLGSGQVKVTRQPDWPIGPAAIATWERYPAVQRRRANDLRLD